MRDIPASIQDQLDGVPASPLKLARCIKVRLRDGTEMGFTDLDESVIVPLDTDLYGAVEYQAGAGLFSGDIVLAVGLEADNTEFEVPLGDIVTLPAVLGKRFNRADVWIFDIDHSAEVPEPMALVRGKITEGRIETGSAIFEVRSIADYWNIVIGEVLTPRCRVDYGSVKCGVGVEQVAATVAIASSPIRITISTASAYDEEYFRYGEILFTTGVLAGLPAVEVVTYDQYTGEIELIEPLAGLPTVGDSLIIKRGCSKLHKAEDPMLSTCVSNNNGRRFRGFKHVPGSDVYLRLASPGSAGA